jgi:hypothetical protein
MSKEERIAALLKAVQEIPNAADLADDEDSYAFEKNELKPLRAQARELQLDLNL